LSVTAESAAPTGSAAAQSRVIVDDAGTVFTIAETPRRIVSLAPNITEILFALGLGDRVVGVTRYCDYPPAALEKDKVGGLLDPDLEKIRSLRPDLIIAFRGNPWDAIDRLRGLRLRVFVLDIGKTLADVPRTIATIGRITLRENEAAALVRSLEDKARALAQVLEAVARKPKVFIEIQGLGAAGIRRDWLEYSRERLLQDDPDIILVMARTEADFVRARAWFETQGGLKDIRAVRNGRVHRLDENAASRFGPRLYDALVEIARLLHPDLFK
jgi:iron complex transport system substrate-binding protein